MVQSGEKASGRGHLIDLLTSIRRRSVPVATSQRCSQFSEPAIARVELSGEKAMDHVSLSRRALACLWRCPTASRNGHRVQ